MKHTLCLLAFVTIVSCQTKDETPVEEAPAAKDEMPAAEEKPAPAQEEPSTPAEENPAAIDVSKTDTLIGMSLEDVQAACKAAGVRCRVVEIDGEPQIVTMDYSPDRLNLKVAGGKITAVTKG